jgi:hypothetical protein
MGAFVATHFVPVLAARTVFSNNQYAVTQHEALVGVVGYRRVERCVGDRDA